MKMRTLEISVGFFIILGVLSLLLMALQVSGLSDFFRAQAGYEITAEFVNVGGLKPRGKVVMAGVTIGRVTKIQLNPETYDAIATLRIKESIRNVPSDSKASILTAGLLGDNYIGISPGFSDEFLAQGSVIPIENTESAVILEQLISKFATGSVDSKTESSNTEE